VRTPFSLRWAARAYAAVCLATLAPAPGVPAAQAAVRGVAAIEMTVDDLDRSVAFFTGVLGFRKESEREVAGAELERLSGVFGARVRTAVLRLGDERLELSDYLAPRGRPYPRGTRANDRWFQHVAIVVSDMDAAYARLREAGVEHASTGPQTLPDSIPAAAGIRAFYFRDPDGHFLELIQFPAGKGDARWQGRRDALFVGIDHTAIVVADTDRALAFYRDALGFAVAGASENSGVEQEHLNNVEHAHLRITALRAPRGPGVELLEYLEPGSGRASRRPIRSNDVAYWQTHVVVDELPRAGDGAEAVRLEPGRGAVRVAHDPDGHALLFVTPP
jgi:catechol 2,3-dioxygenase-like lactoylglutathione lyase family enzyme